MRKLFKVSVSSGIVNIVRTSEELRRFMIAFSKPIEFQGVVIRWRHSGTTPYLRRHIDAWVGRTLAEATGQYQTGIDDLLPLLPDYPLSLALI